MPTLLLAMLLAAGTPEFEGRPAGDHAGVTAELGAWAGLPPLAGRRGSDEVRLWSKLTLGDIWWGWIITPSRVRLYTNIRSVKGIYQGEERLHLADSEPRRDARRLLARFGDVVRLGGDKVACAVEAVAEDGSGYWIEARIHDQHFAFQAGNPTLCGSPAARQFSAALDLLPELEGEWPD